MPQACARVLGNQTCGSGRVVGYLEVENDFPEYAWYPTTGAELTLYPGIG
jgi:hypothetical protein